MAATFPPAPKLSRNARAILRPRREPGRAPAAILALVMHIGFFALIVFGVSWQVHVAAPTNAELWSSLPPLPAVEMPKPSVDEPIQPKVAEKPLPEPIKPPSAPAKVDIALKEKKLRDEKVAEEKRREQERLDKQKKADAALKAEKDKQLDIIRKADAARKAAQDKEKADAAAKEAAAAGARNSAINDYARKISQLIKSRANIPESVAGKPVIQIRLRLLTSGTVFEAQVSKPSGNRVYDDAVERAINGIKQWPLPDNPELLGGRRELTLNIEYEK